jgi:hypothetical protein
MKLAAAKEVLKSLGIDEGEEDIAKRYHYGMDGYHLARELEICGWDMDMQTAEELDCMGVIVDRLYREAEREWAEKNNIQPKLAIGTVIKRGVIAGVYKHGVARYEVKEHGCQRDGRFLLIKFEDAEVGR